MDPDKRLATLALALADGVARGDPASDDLLIEAFDDLAEASRAHAYLTGFLLQLLAEERQEEATATMRYVRSVIDLT
jgi:hypothetical protein